ncbi:proline dehydrogenase family protein [Salinibaculum salinum]|uniref:proline dehydrogenase family protein n=1 Tax=Salinibaculum salinum TaxID=3131996 RepID=UPI0030EDAC7E
MLPPLARRFVAGESAATALERARRLDEDDIGTILNLLGEHYHERAPADADTETYCRLIDDIGTTDLRVCLSVKPSQLGLLVGEDVFRENLARIVERAAGRDIFVWLDMEDHTTTDATLDAFERHAGEHAVGVCVQANLKRTGDDLERLAGLPGNVRLVKGAYDPPADIAHQSTARVDQAYEAHLEYMFEQFDDGIAVGSHDPAMLARAATLHDEYGMPYEIQMLMGVREDAQRDLAGHREVWQYVPYGSRWLSYFYRRVTENVGSAKFALRALLG